MRGTMRRHWPEYMLEAVELSLFLLCACLAVTVLEHPHSPLRHAIPDPTARRIVLGPLMGLVAIGIIYSPWGRRSGAHINPSVTLTFFRLGKIEPWDAVCYIAAQFVGALAGVASASVMLGGRLAAPSVAYIVTVPGHAGTWAALLGESTISFVTMSVVLWTSNTQRLAQFTGLFAGILLAAYIVVEAPISGVSLNPARTLGSAVPAGIWTAIWVYFAAPPLGMLLAAEVYLRWRGRGTVMCAKLNHGHDSQERCIFRCGYRRAMTEEEEPTAA